MIGRMPTLLIRCSLHAALSHEAFGDWVRGRRDELLEAPSVDDLHAARLDDTSWMLTLDVPRESDAATEEVHMLVGDLRLLGLEPVLSSAGDARAGSGNR
jgi:hypothetical protein